MLSGLNVTLLVSGSIACYKSVELLRELQRQGARVQVAMSKSAQAFVTPLTFQTLSGSPVVTELFDTNLEHEIGHISLADKADIIVCAPASANLLAKASYGLADDVISTVLLAAKCPVLFVPAMNVNMWENVATKENVLRLRNRGYHVLDPESGSLACGWVGAGRFPEIDTILDAVNFSLSVKILKGTKVVVSAGPTREKLDPVRFLSNMSSGKMGYALAKVAHNLGAEVTLVSGPTSLKVPSGVKAVMVESAEEMMRAMEEEVNRKTAPEIKLQLIYMTSAVCDHQPEEYSELKLKKDKDKSYEISFKPCPDILSLLGESRNKIEKNSGLKTLLVGFTVDTCSQEDLIAKAEEKRSRKKCDMIVANLANESFGLDTNRVWIIQSNGKAEELAVQSKHSIADSLIKSTLTLV